MWRRCQADLRARWRPRRSRNSASGSTRDTGQHPCAAGTPHALASFAIEPDLVDHAMFDAEHPRPGPHPLRPPDSRKAKPGNEVHSRMAIDSPCGRDRRARRYRALVVERSAVVWRGLSWCGHEGAVDDHVACGRTEARVGGSPWHRSDGHQAVWAGPGQSSLPGADCLASLPTPASLWPPASSRTHGRAWRGDGERAPRQGSSARAATGPMSTRWAGCPLHGRR